MRQGPWGALGGLGPGRRFLFAMLVATLSQAAHDGVSKEFLPGMTRHLQSASAQPSIVFQDTDTEQGFVYGHVTFTSIETALDIVVDYSVYMVSYGQKDQTSTAGWKLVYYDQNATSMNRTVSQYTFLLDQPCPLPPEEIELNATNFSNSTSTTSSTATTTTSATTSWCDMSEDATNLTECRNTTTTSTTSTSTSSTSSTSTSTTSATTTTTTSGNWSSVANMTTTTSTSTTSTSANSTTTTEDWNTSTTVTTTTAVRCGVPVEGQMYLLVRAVGKGPYNDAGRRLLVNGYQFTVDRSIKLVDYSPSAAGEAKANGLSFVDEDIDPGIIGGKAQIIVQKPEPSRIVGYRIYFHGPSGKVSQIMKGGRNPWIVEVQATGDDLEAEIPMGTIIPTAQRLIVVALTQDGDVDEGTVTHIYDAGSGVEATEIPTLEIGIAVVALLGVAFCGLLAWGLFKFLARKAMEDEEKEEKEEERKEEDEAINDQFGFFKPGQSVEYWSFNLKKFAPAVIEDGPVNGHYNLRLAFGDNSKTLSKAPGSRLRHVFHDKEPVEVFLPKEGDEGKWVNGFVDGAPRLGMYNIEFRTESPDARCRPPLRDVPANFVRSCLGPGDQILVPWDKDFRLAKVKTATPPQSVGHFPAQTLVCMFVIWEGLAPHDCKAEHLYSSAVAIRPEYENETMQLPGSLQQNPGVELNELALVV